MQAFERCRQRRFEEPITAVRTLEFASCLLFTPKHAFAYAAQPGRTRGWVRVSRDGRQEPIADNFPSSGQAKTTIASTETKSVEMKDRTSRWDATATMRRGTPESIQ